MTDLLFLTGPPFGPALFSQSRARLGYGEVECVVDPARPEQGWPEFARALAQRLAARPTVLVAHGLAVPAAIGAAALHPPAALVLMNGPVRALDPVTAALARACATPAGRAFVAHSVLLPAPWLGWLRSSAGLRRAVVNPYVMDRDTVATLCGPLVSTAAGRRAVAAWVASLRSLPELPRGGAPTLLLWGDADPLYPASEAAFVEARVAGAQYVAIPGGHHAHPEERPWELADRLAAWLADRAA